MLDQLKAPAKGGSVSAAQRETSDAYGRVICASEAFRVIVCRDNIQWIVQARVRPQKQRATGRWKALKYLRSQRALMAFWHGLHAAKGGTNWPDLDRLPDNFGGS